MAQLAVDRPPIAQDDHHPLRFLIACWPFAGHLYPQVAIAHALSARGHEVAFYTGASAGPLLRDEGFRLFPFQRIDEQALRKRMAEESRKAPLGWLAPKLLIRGLRDVVMGTVPDQVADLAPLVESWRPDVLITDVIMWGPVLVLREALSVPVAISSAFLGEGASPGRRFGVSRLRRGLTAMANAATDKFIALATLGEHRRINRLRAGYGLGPMPYSIHAMLDRLELFLLPSLPELDFSRQDIPPNRRYVGPCVWSHAPHTAWPSWLSELSHDRPWVHVSEGTTHHREPFLLRAAAAGLARKPYEVIVTTGGPDARALGLDDSAPNLHVEPWIDYNTLLPECAVVVTTGGAGTIMAALMAGVPLVVAPTHWDKLNNAKRIVEAGLGVRLDPRACQPDQLASAVERVLTDTSFTERARRISEKLVRAPGPAGAAEFLEALASASTNLCRVPANQ